MHCKDTILRTQNNWPYSKLIPNSGINVTETYLKPFNDKKIDEANEKVISFVKSNGISA